MANRPKTAAELAEEQGALNEELSDSASIACVHAKIEDLRCYVHKISERLTWVFSYVKEMCRYWGINATDEQAKVMIESLNKKIEELDTTALKINDTLIANYTEVNKT